MEPNPFLGVGLHAVGAFSSSSCYTPQKQTKLWSWEIYWITQASCAWLILPIAFAFLTIPNFITVLKNAPQDAMLHSFLLGLIYGVGGLTFGLGIRYIGFSLNYMIAIGISAGLGTIFPLIWRPDKGFVGEITAKFSNLPGWIVLAGIVISLFGIALCGCAGALRERYGGASPSKFNFRVGVPLAVMAGILSAVYNYALIAGNPIADTAVEVNAAATTDISDPLPADAPAEKSQGTKMVDLLKMNAIYPFSNGGAWVTNFIWCLFLIRRNRTGSQLVQLPGHGKGRLLFYYLMALLSGAFWYFQFFFYGMGQAFIGKQYEFTSWALHMAMLILFSNVYGVVFREWKGAGWLAAIVLYTGMAVIVAATLLIAYGNHLGQQWTALT
jgi:L-rhamnose-H+ transport protein